MQLQTHTAGKQGKLTVSDAVFGAPVNKTLLSQAIRVYLANERQGTSKVQTRSEVTLTKKKMYKQKGTGGARHGAKSAPIFVGGGVAHGPKGIENWSLRLPQKQKSLALISALSWQADSITVIDELEKTKGKTSAVAKLLAAATPEAKSILVVIPQADQEVRQGCRNLPNVTIVAARELTALDVVRAHAIIMTSAAVEIIEEKLDKKVEKVASAPKAKKATPAPVAKETKKTTKK